MKAIMVNKGGPGSGHHGHRGRPGLVGGGASSGLTYVGYCLEKGWSPKQKSGKLAGKKFHFGGHDYEIIQGIPASKIGELERYGGEPVAIIHAFDSTTPKEISFTVFQSGRVMMEGRKLTARWSDKFPIKFGDV